MTAYAGEFTLSRLERVLSGPGKTAALGTELDRLQRQRAVVVTGKTLGGSALARRVTDALGSRCTSVFTGARQHVPASAVAALVDVIAATNADCLVSFGGGSPIDMTKVALHAALTARGETDLSAPSTSLVHVSLPTTLSASEYTSVAGVTDDETRVKRAVFDVRATARVVIQDPDLTLETPDWLWAATGMRALDHAIEIIYAARHHPYTDTLSAKAIALFMAHLVPSIRMAGDGRRDHRGACLMASWFSVVGLTHVGFGVSHALGHQLGPKWDIPHGITSCLTLPHAMRLMASLAPERFEAIAQGFGVPWDSLNPKAVAMACADRLASLITDLELPSRIRDLNIPREELPPIAARVHEGMVKAGVSDKPVTLEDVQALLDAAY
ncbi:MAG TPA: iron-containing alcohol dehydrogenase [Vicinamibacterales bacterium]|nr:iron-containing alcohol dehydrogenase [Vicinamibacterales bacterium]